MIECMGSMGVPEPMGANQFHYPDPFSRPAYDYPNSPTIQRLSAPRAKNQFLGSRRSAASIKFRPKLGGQRNGPGSGVLAENGDLAGITPCV